MINIYSDEFLFIWGTTLFSFFIYWGYGLMYLIPDLFYTSLQKYKIQPNIKPLEKKNSMIIFDIIKVVVVNQLVLTPFIASILYRYYENQIIEFPTFFIFCRDIILFFLVIEVCFYYSHRFLHLPFIYKHIHKLHHKYNAPISITALYAHPIEYIISNILPVMIGPILCSSHLVTIYTWLFIVIINTVTVHSGYNIFYILDSTKHDMHHKNFNCNYGVLNILDYLYGILK